MDVVYFAEDARIGLTTQTGLVLWFAECERCGSMVRDTEETKELHIGHHRGWWVKPEESE